MAFVSTLELIAPLLDWIVTPERGVPFARTVPGTVYANVASRALSTALYELRIPPVTTFPDTAVLAVADCLIRDLL